MSNKVAIMKAFYLGFIGGFLLLLSLLASAEPLWRDVTITKIHPMSIDRPHCANCSGIIRIYVNAGPWGNSDCRETAADLTQEDSHLLSVLLTGWTTGKNISLEVNDQSRPVDDVCRVTAASVY